MKENKSSQDAVLWLKRPVGRAVLVPVSGYGREGEHHTGEAIQKLTAENASSVPRPAQREVYHLHLPKDACASAGGI